MSLAVGVAPFHFDSVTSRIMKKKLQTTCDRDGQHVMVPFGSLNYEDNMVICV